MSPELQATEIGKAFSKMRNTLDSAWSYDGQLMNHDDGPTQKQLKKAKELWGIAEEAQAEFIELLERLAK